MDAVALVSGMPSPDLVRAFEAQVKDLPQVDLSTENLIHGRMCARTIFIPAGTVLTGVQTNIDNVCIVSGDITVTTDAGLKRLTGFSVIPAKAGFKRAGIAHADTYWTTIHHTDLDDLKQIEIEMSDESQLLLANKSKEVAPCLG